MAGKIILIFVLPPTTKTFILYFHVFETPFGIKLHEPRHAQFYFVSSGPSRHQSMGVGDQGSADVKPKTKHTLNTMFFLQDFINIFLV